MGGKKSVRQSNVELLRLLAMLLIVVSHFFTHGFESESATVLQLAIANCLSLGNVGVDLFVLITGYFLVNSKFSSRSIISIVGKAYGYAALSAVVAGIVSPGTGLLMVLRSFYPGSLGTFPWFVSVYVALYFTVPLLNRCIASIDKKVHEYILVFGLVVFGILPSFFKIDYMMSSYIWFVYLYFVAGFYRKYGMDFLKKRGSIRLLIGSLALLFSLTSALSLAEFSISALEGKGTFFQQLYSPIILLVSLSIFDIFNNMKMRHSATINLLAASSFGIYLLHDNELTRSSIWACVHQLFGRMPLVLESIISSLFVFIVCACVDRLLVMLVRRMLQRIHVSWPGDVYKRVDSIVNI